MICGSLSRTSSGQLQRRSCELEDNMFSRRLAPFRLRAALQPPANRSEVNKQNLLLCSMPENALILAITSTSCQQPDNIVSIKR